VPPDPSLVDPIVAWRPLDPGDAPALTGLYAAARRADGAPDEVLSVEEMAHRLADPGITLAADTRAGWSADGRLLAWGWVWCRTAPVHLSRAILQGDVHPDIRRRGVGSALLRWQQARATERLTRELPAELPQRIDLFGPVEDPAREALARAGGLTPLRWFVKMHRSMKAPVQPVPVPAGLEMVAWTDGRMDAALEARNDGWQDHWGFEPMPPDVWRHLLVDDPTFLPTASRLAIDGDRVVGFVLCTEQEIDEVGVGRTAWLDMIAVRRAWRRRGVASALIGASLVALGEEGFQAVALDVDADSPTGALGLYERLGFQALRTEALYARDVTATDGAWAGTPVDTAGRSAVQPGSSAGVVSR
jgi:mycothiol synthase